MLALRMQNWQEKAFWQMKGFGRILPIFLIVWAMEYSTGVYYVLILKFMWIKLFAAARDRKGKRKDILVKFVD